VLTSETTNGGVEHFLFDAFGGLTISTWRLTALRPCFTTGLPLSVQSSLKRTAAHADTIS